MPVFIMKIRNKVYILLALILLLLTTPITAMADTDAEHTLERQIKLAFLYNFIKFVDWPLEITTDTNKPIIIGIIGNEDFSDAFKPLKNKKIKNRNVFIKQFKNIQEIINTKDKKSWQNQKIDELKQCRLLFFCHSLKKEDSSRLLKSINALPILTVGETTDFLKNGGIINFLVEDKKVRFEINLEAAKQNNLKIRSKLLKLAKKVVKENPSDKD